MKKRAFTILEVIVSIGLLALTLVVLGSAIGTQMAAAQHGGNVTQAESYARQILEYIGSSNLPFTLAVNGLPPSNSGINDSPGVTRTLGAVPLDTSGIAFPSSSTYTRHVTVMGTATGGEPNGYKSELDQVAVTVLWWEGGRQRSVTLSTFQRRRL